MKAVFLDYATMGPGLNLDGLRDAVDELTVYDNTRRHKVVERVGDAEIIFTNKNRLTPEILSDLPNLRFVGLTATGSDNVDLESAKRHGVAIANIRDYCTESVVEHVFGVLLMLTHSLERYAATVRAGDWQRCRDPLLLNHPVTELRGKTMGIVGFGTLGEGVARMAEAFGMQVLVSARPDAGSAPEGRAPFDDVLSNADVLSLHCPLNDETRGLLGAAEFERMKSSAIVINTARGGLSDEARQNAIDELEANTRAFIAGKDRNRIA